MFLRFKTLAAGCLLSFAVPSLAQQTVWSTDIAPILYNNCASCHRPSGIAPFSLLTYQDASIYGSAIAGAVSARRMPPWPPDPEYNRLAHERILSENDIQKIVSWVNNGKPEGDPTLAPPTPVFSNDGQLPGTPDLVLQIPEYTSTASMGDVYQCFVIPSNLANDRFFTAFEAVPGNKSIVHHVLVYADTSGVCAQLDAATPEPGYTSFGGVGSNDAMLIGGWVPGTQPQVYPPGFGVRIPAGADIVIQIHYPAGSAGLVDSTKINFYFSPGFVRPVFIDPAINHFFGLTNGPLIIPANETKTFHAEFPVPAGYNFSVLGVAPHMHLIGRNIHSYVVSPAGDTTRFIRINNWDFHWQGFYMLPKIVKVEEGSTLHAFAHFDNTTNNPLNPNNPPQTVYAGESTTDEMMLIYFLYTVYLPGDENIVIDTIYPLNVTHREPYYKGQQLLQVYPNPAKEEILVKLYSDKKDNFSAFLVNMNGQIVHVYKEEALSEPGYHVFRYRLPALAPGMYQLQLRGSSQTFTEKILIQ